MRNIMNLPKEIFQNIVKNLEPNDFRSCQEVSKSWYRPFHLLFLKDITIGEESYPEAFVDSINFNPDPAYLDSVKSITFLGAEAWICLEEEVLLESLFFRFRNLEKVDFWSLHWLSLKIDDALYQKFQSRCPKLDIFSVHFLDQTGFNDNWEPTQGVDEYYEGLLQIRQLLTHMDAVNIDYAGDYCTLGYVSQFPRLREIVDGSRWFYTLEEWLPILQNLPNYQTIDITSEKKDTNLAVNYMAAQSKEIQTKSLERLSKLHGLNLHGVLENSLEFARKYMTGLESFFCTSNFALHDDWSELQIQRYFEKVWNLASTSTSSNVLLKGLKHAFLSANLPSVTSNNEQSTPYTNRLHFFLKRANVPEPESTNLVIESTKKQYCRYILVAFSKGTSINDIGSNVLLSQVDNVSALKLEMEKKDEGTASISAYYKILRKIPSLKSLVLDIPTSLTVDEPTIDYCGPKVKEMTIRATEDMNLEPMLKQFYHALPNIKSLSIYYCSGTWNQDSGQFDLDLSAYSLERLTVDLSPMKNKSLKFLTSQIPLDDHFFVVNVTNNGKQQMYQLPLDFTSVTKVDDDDLLGFECEIDFYQLNITIHNLHYLHFYINYDRTYYYKSNFKNGTVSEYYVPKDNSKARVVEFDYGK